jgi:hypothetical protein
MSGTLTIDKPNGYPGVHLNAGAGYSYIRGLSANKTQWECIVGGGGAGDLQFQRYDDAGAFVTNALTINRANGNVTVRDLFLDRADGTGALFFGAAPSSKYIYWNANKFDFTHGLSVNGNVIASGFLQATGTLSVGGAIYAGNNTAGGTYYFGNAGSRYLQHDGNATLYYGGGRFNIQGGGIDCNGYINTLGNVVIAGGYSSRNGTAGTNGANYYNLNWTGAMQLWVDTTLLGNIQYILQDFRIMRDVKPLTTMWDAVKQLNPIKYTHKDYTPPPTEEVPEPAPAIVADEVERWGFLAHELQDTLIGSAASGNRDDAGSLQSGDAMTLIAALTKALQEAMLRIELLEGRKPA